jgi:hypothetical protein
MGLAEETERPIPTPLAGHPGNVFLAGEAVVIPVPAQSTRWRAVDIDGKVIGEDAVVDDQDSIRLGTPSVGWYRIEFLDSQGKMIDWTTAGVLSRLESAPPDDSPVCVDSATAWFARHYPNEEEQHQEILANLSALAGVNWIRDRMSWGDLQPSRDTFAEQTRYDSSASLATSQGLKVLQVFHSTPRWAIDNELDGRLARSRFARDLRDHFTFCRAMARRFHGRVLAWEPWNEANISVFGGHTIDEMCTLQKAAYLGFKAGDDDVCVGWNVYAGSGSPLHTQGVIANEAWPYFETYNIHSYSTPDRYVSQFETARQAACGRPLWITECGIRLNTNDKPPWGDLAPADERKQAEFVAKSFAASLFAGVNRHFFFILGNYIENGVQFGLLRHDHTPRPGYLALAAVGRFLAGAQCVGRVSPNIYAFRARPDGREREVLVVWGDGSDWPLPADLPTEGMFDHLGRSLGNQRPTKLGPEPVFVLLPLGTEEPLELERPPKFGPSRDGDVSPVVLQVSLPAKTSQLDTQSHEVEPGEKNELPLYVYNFSDQPVSGVLKVEDPPLAWQVSVSTEPIRVQPMGRERVPASVTVPPTGRGLLPGTWIKLRGDFGDAGQPVLALRLTPDLIQLRPATSHVIEPADEPVNWEDNIVAGGVMSHRAGQPSGVLFDMQFADTDPWAYPRLRLKEGDIPSDECDGLALNVHVLQGSGSVRVQFIEQSGAAYSADVGVDAESRESQRAVVLFRRCQWGSYTPPDPDGRLQPSNIRAILVGINAERNSQVRMVVSALEWIRY